MKETGRAGLGCFGSWQSIHRCLCRGRGHGRHDPVNRCILHLSLSLSRPHSLTPSFHCFHSCPLSTPRDTPTLSSGTRSETRAWDTTTLSALRVSRYVCRNAWNMRAHTDGGRESNVVPSLMFGLSFESMRPCCCLHRSLARSLAHSLTRMLPTVPTLSIHFVLSQFDPVTLEGGASWSGVMSLKASSAAE